MSKVAVVYWSSTGNTEAMANAVADGIKEKGGEAVLHTCEDFDGSKVAEYDLVPMDGETANGCVTGKIPAKKSVLTLYVTA